MKRFFTLLLVLSCNWTFAQPIEVQNKIDSLHLILNNATDENRVNILNELSMYYRSTDIQTSVKMARVALVVSKSIDYKEGTIASLENLVKYYETSFINDSIVLTYQKLIPIYEEKKEKVKLANAFNQLGFTLINISDYSSALDNFVKALVINEELKDSSAIGGNYSNMGIIMNLLNEQEHALEYFEKAQTYLGGGKNDRFLSQVIMNIGDIHKAQKNYDLAVEKYTEAMSLQQKINYTSGYANTLSSLSDLYIEKNEYDNALKYAQIALEKATEQNNYVTICSANFSFGSVYSKKGNFAKAVEYFKQGLNTAESYQLIHWKSKFYKELANLYGEKGLYQDAYKSLSLYNNINDSINSHYVKDEVDKAKTMIDIERNKSNEYVNQIDELKADFEKFKRNNYTIEFVLSCLVVILALAWFFKRKI